MSYRCMKRRSQCSCLKKRVKGRTRPNFSLSLSVSLPLSPPLSSYLSLYWKGKRRNPFLSFYLIQMKIDTHIYIRTHAYIHARGDCSAHQTAAGFGYKTIQIFSRKHCSWPNTPQLPSGLRRVTQTRLPLEDGTQISCLRDLSQVIMLMTWTS